MNDRLKALAELAVFAVVVVISVLVFLKFMTYLDPLILEFSFFLSSWAYNTQPVCVRTPSCYEVCSLAPTNSRPSRGRDYYELVEWNLLEFNEFPQNNFTCECVFCHYEDYLFVLDENNNTIQTVSKSLDEIKIKVFTVRRECYG